MREHLFIDCVEFEWGLRAKAGEFQSVGVNGMMMMAYTPGNKPLEFLGKRCLLDAPLRHCYHFYDAPWMCQGWLPAQRHLAYSLRLLLKFGFYLLFAEPRFRHLGMMAKGVVHGLVERMGRLN